jgi:hypothetical protein
MTVYDGTRIWYRRAPRRSRPLPVSVWYWPTAACEPGRGSWRVSCAQVLAVRLYFENSRLSTGAASGSCRLTSSNARPIIHGMTTRSIVTWATCSMIEAAVACVGSVSRAASSSARLTPSR